MARLLPPPRGVTYAGEAGPPGRKNNSPRGRASLAEGGGAQGTGGRGAAVPPTGPWRGSHTPHPGEVRLSQMSILFPLPNPQHLISLLGQQHLS